MYRQLYSKNAKFNFILEAYLSKVSPEYFESLNISNRSEVTLEQLGLLYKTHLYNNSGLNGVCWEYAVFNSIYYNDQYIQWLMNVSINYLTGKVGLEHINAILRGGEKLDLHLENIKSCLKEIDTIWTPYGEYNFKNYIDLIYNSFRLKKDRKQLPKSIKNIWKADLFVKKESENQWLAVTVKWNKNELKYCSGLSIGVCFEPIVYLNKTYYNNPSLEKNNDNITNFVRCCIPYKYNYGEY